MTPSLNASSFNIPTSLRVLIVDDTEVIRKVMLMLFKKLGLAAESVENGLDAVAKVRTTDYDLIMMDVRMPLMDGLLAAKIIRSEKGCHCPIIIGLSGDGSPEDVQSCLDAGMDAHIIKPPKIDALLGTIANLIAQKQSC